MSCAKVFYRRPILPGPPRPVAPPCAARPDPPVVCLGFGFDRWNMKENSFFFGSGRSKNTFIFAEPPHLRRSRTPLPSSVRSSTHSSEPKIEDEGIFYDLRGRGLKIEGGGFFDFRLRRSKMGGSSIFGGRRSKMVGFCENGVDSSKNPRCG